MKVLTISGSPRKEGNTETIIAAMSEVLKTKGAEVEQARLNDFPLQGCQACKYCRTKGEKCVLDDGISAVLEKMREADRIIIGAPNYMGTVSGQLKILLDRMYSLKDSGRNPRFQPGKKGVLIFTQGNSNTEAYAASYGSVKKIVESNNIEIIASIVAYGVEAPGEVRENPEIMARVIEAAEAL